MDRILYALSVGNIWLAMCLARQLGKSIGLAIFLIWAGWYNKLPKTILKITTIYLISRDDDASIELLDKIRGILHDGDKVMFQYTQTDDFFTGSLKEPNNTHQITFLNGCFIKSIPPTGKVLGKSASIVVIDEAHRLQCDNPEKFFNQFVVPTIAETGGIIILSSSPEGIVGFFYEAIDPENKNPDSKYETIWFDHTIWDDGTEECIRYQAFVKSEKDRLGRIGRLKEAQQEYDALFTVTQSSFFENEDIDDNIEDTPIMYEHNDTPCSVGYDYGMTNSRTVITVRTKMNGKIIELFQYRAEAGFDNNYLHDPEWEHSIQKLKKRYNLSLGIYADDCPNGNDNNNWMKKNSDLPVHLHNFRSDQMSKTDGLNRNCVAYAYRARLKEGVLKIPKWNTIQKFEMKIVQEVSQKILITIKSPAGHLCDTFDSDMMACIPFIDIKDVSDFECDSLEEQKPDEKKSDWNRRFDDKEGLKNLSDEDMKEIMKDKDYERLAY